MSTKGRRKSHFCHSKKKCHPPKSEHLPTPMIGCALGEAKQRGRWRLEAVFNTEMDKSTFCKTAALSEGYTRAVKF